MPTRISAGLLMYRARGGRLQALLAHPGGPFFVHRDEGYWTIPKGEIDPGESMLATAIREFEEEVGIKACRPFHELGSIRQKGGKIVHAWAVEGDWDDSMPVQSNTFEMEWPPGSGRQRAFAEVDQAKFFFLPEARLKIKETQRPFLDRLEAWWGGNPRF